MASSKRERELARMRAERQAARRAAAEARRRKQRQTILASVAAVAVVAIVVLVFVLSGGTKKKDTLTQPVASASPVVAGSCSYPDRGTASKKVKGKPPTSGVNTTTPVKVALDTNRGEIDLNLNAAKAPCTVNSFAFLAAQKYFNNTSCHRLTTSGIYVLQCGDPSATGAGGPGYSFADENLTGATYPKGTIAMANAGAATNGSQFFLVYKDTQLQPQFTPFGTITKGLDVLEGIAKAGTASPSGDGKPRVAVSIQAARVR